MSLVGYCYKSGVLMNYALVVVQFLNIKTLYTPLTSDVYSMSIVTSEIAFFHQGYMQKFCKQ